MANATKQPPVVVAGSVLDSLFKDFDKEDVFNDIMAHAVDPKARNFVVEFGGERARIAKDLEAQHFVSLLKQKRERRRRSDKEPPTQSDGSPDTATVDERAADAAVNETPVRWM